MVISERFKEGILAGTVLLSFVAGCRNVDREADGINSSRGSYLSKAFRISNFHDGISYSGYNDFDEDGLEDAYFKMNDGAVYYLPCRSVIDNKDNSLEWELTRYKEKSP